MPNAQAVEVLANRLAEIYNSSLPTPDPSLPVETQQEMASAMQEIRERNINMGAEIADAINIFIRKSSVTNKLPWQLLRLLLTGRIKPIVKIRLEDIVWCQNNPGQAKTLSTGSNIELAPFNDTATIYLNQDNAIT